MVNDECNTPIPAYHNILRNAPLSTQSQRMYRPGRWTNCYPV